MKFSTVAPPSDLRTTALRAGEDGWLDHFGWTIRVPSATEYRRRTTAECRVPSTGSTTRGRHLPFRHNPRRPVKFRLIAIRGTATFPDELEMRRRRSSWLSPMNPPRPASRTKVRTILVHASRSRNARRSSSPAALIGRCPLKEIGRFVWSRLKEAKPLRGSLKPSFDRELPGINQAWRPEQRSSDERCFLTGLPGE